MSGSSTAAGSRGSEESTLAQPPGRLAFAGDWHGNQHWAVARVQSLVEGGVDTIVHCGDLGVWPGSEGVRYLDSLQKVAERCKVRLYAVDGNHDDHDQLAALPRDPDGLGVLRPRVRHLPRGIRWEWAGLRFAALGGAASVDRASRTPGRTWWPQEVLSEADQARFRAGGPADVVITHDVPAGVAVPGITHESGVRAWGYAAIAQAEAHSELLAAALAPTRPGLIVHGHMHVRYTARWNYPGGQARVEGLDCDGARRNDNVLVATLADIAALAGRPAQHNPGLNPTGTEQEASTARSTNLG